MRKIFVTAALSLSVLFLAGCSKSVDYTAYISERRNNIYLYSDDQREIRIDCSQREQPYAADGYCGEVCEIVEIFACFAQNPSSVRVSVEGYSGEMNYQSVENRFCLSFSAAEFKAESVEVTLSCDGNEQTYTLLGARTSAVMSCNEALKCVIEYDGELFRGLTRNGIFGGEIYVRLLYDGGCYYYVGVCDKDKTVHAYLLDGERGKIIATRQLQG